MNSGRILVIEQEPAAGIGNFGDWLSDAGLAVQICRPHLGDAVPETTRCEGLIVLGGPMGATDDQRASWLPATRALLRWALEYGTPTLGICLGAQLLAVSSGGRAEPGMAGPEIGAAWVTIDAPDDPLLRGLINPAPFVQWHFDAITELPPGAAELASSTMYRHQVFRVGKRAWGVGFHPEVRLDDLKVWAALTAPELQARGIDTDTAVRDTYRLHSKITSASRTVASNFATIVKASEL